MPFFARSIFSSLVTIYECAHLYLSKLREKNHELAEKTEYVKKQEKVAKENEDKKEELKSRALETIKE